MIFEFSLMALGILLTWLWVRRNPDAAQRTYNWLERSRKAIGAVVLVLLAWTFIISGNILLQFAAIILVVLGALYFFVEEPHKGGIT